MWGPRDDSPKPENQSPKGAHLTKKRSPKGPHLSIKRNQQALTLLVKKSPKGPHPILQKQAPKALMLLKKSSKGLASYTKALTCGVQVGFWLNRGPRCQKNCYQATQATNLAATGQRRGSPSIIRRHSFPGAATCFLFG